MCSPFSPYHCIFFIYLSCKMDWILFLFCSGLFIFYFFSSLSKRKFIYKTQKTLLWCRLSLSLDLFIFFTVSLIVQIWCTLCMLWNISIDLYWNYLNTQIIFISFGLLCVCVWLIQIKDKNWWIVFFLQNKYENEKRLQRLAWSHRSFFQRSFAVFLCFDDFLRIS